MEIRVGPGVDVGVVAFDGGLEFCRGQAGEAGEFFEGIGFVDEVGDVEDGVVAVVAIAGVDDAEVFAALGIEDGPEAGRLLGGDDGDSDFGFVLFEDEASALCVDPDGGGGRGEVSAFAFGVEGVGEAGGIVPLVVEAAGGAKGRFGEVHGVAVSEEAAADEDPFRERHAFGPGGADDIEIVGETAGGQ